MEGGWQSQDLAWLMAIPIERVQGTRVPPETEAAAIANGKLIRLLNMGEMIKPNAMAADTVLLARTREMRLRFAVRNVLPCIYPGRPEITSLGLAAETTVRAGPLSGLCRLWQEAGIPEKLSLRDAYEKVLQSETEKLWRSTAASLSEVPLSRPAWLEQIHALTNGIQTGMVRLFLHHGLILTGECRLSSLAPVRVKI